MEPAVLNGFWTLAFLTNREGFFHVVPEASKLLGNIGDLLH